MPIQLNSLLQIFLVFLADGLIKSLIDACSPTHVFVNPIFRRTAGSALESEKIITKLFHNI